jgi:class 3 adenylate cyclase
MFLLVSFSLVGLYIFAQDGVYTLPPEELRARTISNLIIPLGVLGLLINYYSRSALSAEHRLQKEKQVTEQQNFLLAKQRDELSREQGKTTKLLDKIQSLFGQQVSEEVANELIHNPADFDSKQYDVSVMFVDIRDFSVFADSRSPNEVASFQNAVFGELIQVVRQHNGVVLQILGDGILAVFGAPVARDDHARFALLAGESMLERIEALGQSGAIPPIRIGIGVHSGPVLAGNVGNESRRFYSLTGKTVIIAARIEQLNKDYGSQFLASGATVSSAGHRKNPVRIGPMNLKGIEQPVEIFRLA